MGKLRRPTKGTSFTLSIQSVGGVGAGCRVPGAGCREPGAGYRCWCRVIALPWEKGSGQVLSSERRTELTYLQSQAAA